MFCCQFISLPSFPGRCGGGWAGVLVYASDSSSNRTVIVSQLPAPTSKRLFVAFNSGAAAARVMTGESKSAWNSPLKPAAMSKRTRPPVFVIRKRCRPGPKLIQGVATAKMGLSRSGSVSKWRVEVGRHNRTKARPSSAANTNTNPLAGSSKKVGLGTPSPIPKKTQCGPRMSPVLDPDFDANRRLKDEIALTEVGRYGADVAAMPVAFGRLLVHGRAGRIAYRPGEDCSNAAPSLPPSNCSTILMVSARLGEIWRTNGARRRTRPTGRSLCPGAPPRSAPPRESLSARSPPRRRPAASPPAPGIPVISVTPRSVYLDAELGAEVNDGGGGSTDNKGGRRKGKGRLF